MTESMVKWMHTYICGLKPQHSITIRERDCLSTLGNISYNTIVLSYLKQ